MLKLSSKLRIVSGFVCPSCAFTHVNRIQHKISFQRLEKRNLHRHQTITREIPRAPPSNQPQAENDLNSLEYRKRCIKKMRRAIKYEKYASDAEMEKMVFFMRQGYDENYLFLLNFQHRSISPR